MGTIAAAPKCRCKTAAIHAKHGRAIEPGQSQTLDPIATVIECCEEPREPALGHPPAETVRVLATLRRFLRKGTPWRSLRTSAGQASGSTLRRAFERWARMGLLRKVHPLLVATAANASRFGELRGNRLTIPCCGGPGAAPFAKLRRRRSADGARPSSDATCVKGRPP
jgi:transposase